MEAGADAAEAGVAEVDGEAAGAAAEVEVVVVGAADVATVVERRGNVMVTRSSWEQREAERPLPSLARRRRRRAIRTSRKVPDCMPCLYVPSLDCPLLLYQLYKTPNVVTLTS